MRYTISYVDLELDTLFFRCFEEKTLQLRRRHCQEGPCLGCEHPTGEKCLEILGLDWRFFHGKNPLVVVTNTANWKMAIEIVDLSIQHGYVSLPGGICFDMF